MITVGLLPASVHCSLGHSLVDTKISFLSTPLDLIPHPQAFSLTCSVPIVTVTTWYSLVSPSSTQ